MLILIAAAAVQSANISVTILSAQNAVFTGSGPSGTCELKAISATGRASGTIPADSKTGSPSLNLKLSSPNVSNPQNVTLKIRLQPQTEGNAIVYRDSTGVFAKTRATATGAQTVSFSVPRNANGTRQLEWSSSPLPPKARVILKHVMLPSWSRVNGQSTANVSIPTECNLQVSTQAESPLGPGSLKEESAAFASAKLHVNILSVYATKTNPTRSYGSIIGPASDLFVDVYNLNGTPVENYWVNAGTSGSGTYELDFEDFSSTSVNAYYYTPGSLRKKYTFNGSLSYAVDFTPIMGDVDGDNDVDSADITALNANLGATSVSFVSLGGAFVFENYDLDRNGVIDNLDVQIAQANIGLMGDL